MRPLPRGTTLSDVAVAGGGLMRVPSADADILYVLPLDQPRGWKRLNGIPPWIPDETVPIVRKEVRFSVTVDDVSVSVAAWQYPVTSALVMTAYKVQGKTIDFIFLLEWSSFFAWCVAFVVFTRVREMRMLFIACPLTWETAQTFTPPPELVAELGRLRALGAETAARDGPSAANASLLAKAGLSAMSESVAQALRIRRQSRRRRPGAWGRSTARSSLQRRRSGYPWVLAWPSPQSTRWRWWAPAPAR